jgi:hypothetical protein
MRYVSAVMREIAKKEDKAIFIEVYVTALFPTE